VKADPQELIGYAAEDTLGGYHWDERQRQFPSGSLWQVEGQMLYALVRWLKPDTHCRNWRLGRCERVASGSRR
jgi:hypothetical protein